MDWKSGTGIVILVVDRQRPSKLANSATPGRQRRSRMTITLMERRFECSTADHWV
jgi:hypothetical protein